MSEVESENIYLPGAASLLEQLDKRVMIILRDGKHLVGILKSVDQFLNLILENTVERIIFAEGFCDIELGIYIVRGENIVLLAELSEEDENNPNFKKINPEQLVQINDQLTHKVTWDFD